MSADPVELWHVPQSRSFRVLWFLHEAEIPHQVHYLGFDGASLRTPEHLARSLAGRVPALSVRGEVAGESGALIEFLAETRAPHLARPPGHPERLRWLEGLHYAETLGQHLANLTQHHVILREDHMRSPTVMRLEAARLSRGLAGLLARTRGQEWLLPSGFSAADVALGWSLWASRLFVDPQSLPGLAEWQARITARPAFQAALAADGPALIYQRSFYPPPEG